MSGSLEVRQFLMRYEGADAMGVRRSGGVPTQRSGHPEPPRVSDDQVRRARLAVARGATDAHDCAQLLDMLGLVAQEGEPPPVQR